MFFNDHHVKTRLILFVVQFVMSVILFSAVFLPTVTVHAANYHSWVPGDSDTYGSIGMGESDDDGAGNQPDPSQSQAIEAKLGEMFINLATGFNKRIKDSGFDLTNIVLGRLKAGVTVNEFGFELYPGNSYGYLGSKVFVVFRSIVYVLLAVFFILATARQAFSASTRQISDYKDLVLSVFLMFSALALYPQIIDFILFIRDLVLKIVVNALYDTSHGISITGAYYNAYKLNPNVVTSIIYFSAVIATAYFGISYISIAVTQTVIFILLPVATLLGVRDKKLISGSFEQFIGNAMIPILDMVVLAIPLNIEGNSVVKLAGCFCVIPARGLIRQVLGLGTSGIAEMVGMGSLFAGMQSIFGVVQGIVGGGAAPVIPNPIGGGGGLVPIVPPMDGNVTPGSPFMPINDDLIGGSIGDGDRKGTSPISNGNDEAEGNETNATSTGKPGSGGTMPFENNTSNHGSRISDLRSNIDREEDEMKKELDSAQKLDKEYDETEARYDKIIHRKEDERHDLVEKHKKKSISEEQYEKQVGLKDKKIVELKVDKTKKLNEILTKKEEHMDKYAHLTQNVAREKAEIRKLEKAGYSDSETVTSSVAPVSDAKTVETDTSVNKTVNKTVNSTNVLPAKDSTVISSSPVYTGGGSSQGVAVSNYAQQFVGNPYVWGGTSLTNGADCSGFVQSVYKNFGVSLPRNSVAQRSAGVEVEGGLANVRPGDILCYDKTTGKHNHVAMYIGNGQIIHASNPKSGIKISNVNYRMPCNVRRIYND